MVMWAAPVVAALQKPGPLSLHLHALLSSFGLLHFFKVRLCAVRSAATQRRPGGAPAVTFLPHVGLPIARTLRLGRPKTVGSDAENRPHALLPSLLGLRLNSRAPVAGPRQPSPQGWPARGCSCPAKNRAAPPLATVSESVPQSSSPGRRSGGENSMTREQPRRGREVRAAAAAQLEACGTAAAAAAAAASSTFCRRPH